MTAKLQKHVVQVEIKIENKNIYCRVLLKPETLCFLSLKAELKPIYHLLALLEAHHILRVSRIRVNQHYVIFMHIILKKL